MHEDKASSSATDVIDVMYSPTPRRRLHGVTASTGMQTKKRASRLCRGFIFTCHPLFLVRPRVEGCTKQMTGKSLLLTIG
jgi:hypothetical protein